jgi:uncharacterized membrane protein YdjX (TVP38/TMEM64 family)
MQLLDWVIAFLAAHGTLDASGMVALAAVFGLTGLVPIPRTALCLASGAIFGAAAILVIMPSTTLCSLAGFLMARHLFSAPLYRFAERRVRWRAVLRAVDEEGWRIVGLMRFASAMPTFMQNYLFGLTRIETLPYVLATFVFTIPQVCLYVYLGALGRAALLDRSSSGWSLALTGLAAVCMLTVVLLVARKVRIALRDKGVKLSATR